MAKTTSEALFFRNLIILEYFREKIKILKNCLLARRADPRARARKFQPPLNLTFLTSAP